MNPDPRPIVVIKVGGSLLNWPGLPARIARESAERMGTDARPLLVVGGGALADAIRDLDRVHGIGEPASHVLALRALDVSARVVEQVAPGVVVAETLDQLDPAWQAGRVPILAPRRFLEEVDRQGPSPLPRTWNSTTDAIAARVASHLRAAELALWKSAPLPPNITPGDAVRLGLVDPEFPRAIRGIPLVTYQNLREQSPRIAWVVHTPRD